MVRVATLEIIEKTLVPKVGGTSEVKVMDWRLLQPVKAVLPISVKPGGKVIDVIP